MNLPFSFLFNPSAITLNINTLNNHPLLKNHVFINLRLNETTPRKRLSLSLRLSSTYTQTTAIFTHFLRLPDALAATAHFRPEVQRKLRHTREEEARKLRKVDEGERAEERKLEGDRRKKEARGARLKGMSADEQRKFLEREREKGNKKQEKKLSRKA